MKHVLYLCCRAWAVARECATYSHTNVRRFETYRRSAASRVKVVRSALWYQVSVWLCAVDACSAVTRCSAVPLTGGERPYREIGTPTDIVCPRKMCGSNWISHPDEIGGLTSLPKPSWSSTPQAVSRPGCCTKGTCMQAGIPL
jgi:hypothetical protein